MPYSAICRRSVARRLAATCAVVFALAMPALLGGCAAKYSSVATAPAPLQAAPAVAPPQAIEPAAPSAATGDQVHVALLLPLSGPNAGIGRAMLDAAQIALFDIADEHFVLLPRDTEGTPEGAGRAATAAIADHAELILGPLLAGEVEAVKPLARQAGISMVAFSTADQLAGDGTFLLSFPPRPSVNRVVAFARERGAMRFAALAPATPYGQLVVESLRAAANSVGASVVQTETYEPGATDYRPVVRRLASFDERRAALARTRAQLSAAGDEASRQALQRLAGSETAGDLGFDAVLLPDGDGQLKAVASLLPYFDIDPGKVRFLGTGLWDEPGLGTEPALVGGWFAAPPPAPRAEFERRFRELYNQAPPRLATLGYDATALAAILARKPRSIAFTPESLADPSGFSGVDGIFRFRPDGLVERGLAVLEIDRTGSRIVSPAPESFEAPAT
ncbi:MAG TPA: penicillin-binding protein activator [Stellaceae bacterium]|nr:penicillin-binding protein activator [Stellaceae bacterium]